MKIIPVLTIAFFGLLIIKSAIFMDIGLIGEDNPVPEVSPDFPSFDPTRDRLEERLVAINDSWDAPGLFDNTTAGFWDFVTGDTIATVFANLVEIIFNFIEFFFLFNIMTFGLLVDVFILTFQVFMATGKLVIDAAAWGIFFISIAFTPLEGAPWFVNTIMMAFSGLYLLALILSIFRGSDVS